MFDCQIQSKWSPIDYAGTQELLVKTDFLDLAFFAYKLES